MGYLNNALQSTLKCYTDSKSKNQPSVTDYWSDALQFLCYSRVLEGCSAMIWGAGRESPEQRSAVLSATEYIGVVLCCST
ncbi:hypothetical protein FKM82_024674 [Ascaphus truei]